MVYSKFCNHEFDNVPRCRLTKTKHSMMYAFRRYTISTSWMESGTTYRVRTVCIVALNVPLFYKSCTV